jgi:hypothetical protein
MHTKQEIIEGYKSIWKQVEDVVSKVDSTQFLAKTDEKTWSIAEEFDHVLKAASAMSSAMKNKPILLKWKFGKPNRPLRTYKQAYNRYKEKLALVNGKAVAPASFRSEENKTFDKEDMLKHWNMTLSKFEQRINKWSDKNLDKVLLPHPLLGKMMVRELLFFTHFHTEHHLKSLIKKAETTV